MYAITTAGDTVLAATSIGLLSSTDNGLSWTLADAPQSADWRFLAAAKKLVVAASLHDLRLSTDSGVSWLPVTVPGMVTQISAAAVDRSGAIWLGSREGVFVSTDGGANWATPKNLYVSSVANIFYDDSVDKMIVTTGGESSIVFSVQLPQRQITYAYSGWSLRFARPVGDHFVAATMFDGIVVEPKMVELPMEEKAAATTPATH